MPVGSKEDLIQAARRWVADSTGLGLEKILAPRRADDVPAGSTTQIEAPAPPPPYVVVNVSDSGQEIETYHNFYSADTSERIRTVARQGVLALQLVGEDSEEYATLLAMLRDDFREGTLTQTLVSLDVSEVTEDDEIQRRHALDFQLEYKMSINTPTTGATSAPVSVDLDGRTQTIDGDLTP